MFAPFETLHQDPIAPVILGVTGILFFAIIGRFAAQMIGQPSVLGELTIGILLGNIGYFLGIELFVVLREGTAIFDMAGLALTGQPMDAAAEAAFGEQKAGEILSILRSPGGNILVMVAHVVDVFSRYGVLFLLFLIGLDSSMKKMRSVGWISVRVAVIGVCLPFILGLIVINIIAPALSANSSLFVAASLVATSVAISASVLQELRKSDSAEGKTILGAAVFDDLLGLVILAIVSGFVVSGEIELWSMLQIVVLACGFLLGAVYLGSYVIRGSITLLSSLGVVETKIFTGLLFVMVLSWIASFIGLAAIVGAFTAGLILHESFFKDLPGNDQTSMKELIRPLELILAPIFFVVIGMQVKIENFLDPAVILLAAGLLVAATAGKVASGWGVQKGMNRWLVGFGMMPRGEVSLIFASIGKTLNVISDSVFAALVLVVVVAMLAAPPCLKAASKWSS